MKALVFSGIILLLMLGCTQHRGVGEDEPVRAATLNYSDQHFSFEYPDWPDADKADQNFLVKNNRSCVFAAARYPGMPSRFFKAYVESRMNGTFSEGSMDYTMDVSDTVFSARTSVAYCNYDTYTLTLACIGALPEAEAALLNTATCTKRVIKTVPKLAMIPVPPNDDPSSMVSTIKDARENGVDVLDWYFDWKTLDGNWTVSDYIMEPLAYEGRSAAMVEVIHTSVLSEYPDRFESFDDPGFKEEFAEFSGEFVSRYKPDYFFVGGEVDDYLYSHRDKTPAFKELLRATREKVKQANPGTRFGFTVTYHDALAHNATDIAQELASEADMIAYTSYGYHGMFVFDNVSRGVEYLEGVKDIVPGKPYAIIETGWSSSTLLNSSENKQAEFAVEYFDFISSTDAEFVKWWGMHDGEDCTEGAESFLTDMPEVEENREFMAVFTEYLCSLGLKRSDGTPKQAWAIWQERVEEEKE